MADKFHVFIISFSYFCWDHGYAYILFNIFFQLVRYDLAIQIKHRLDLPADPHPLEEPCFPLLLSRRQDLRLSLFYHPPSFWLQIANVFPMPEILSLFHSFEGMISKNKNKSIYISSYFPLFLFDFSLFLFDFPLPHKKEHLLKGK